MAIIAALLRIGSTNLVELTGLQDTVTDAYPTDATVTATLSDDGTPVTDAADLPCEYVSGTSGASTTYRGEIPATVSLSPKVYTLTVTATDTNDNVRVFTVAATAST